MKDADFYMNFYMKMMNNGISLAYRSFESLMTLFVIKRKKPLRDLLCLT